MKTIILSLTLLFGLITSISAAAIPTAKKTNMGYIESTIQRSIHLSEAFTTAVGQKRILVVFTVLGNGSVWGNEVGTNNAQMKNSLINQFQRLSFAVSNDRKPQMYSI
jgi:hypothetical protein